MLATIYDALLKHSFFCLSLVYHVPCALTCIQKYDPYKVNFLKEASKTLHSMFSHCPPDYQPIHTEITWEGTPVLAMGYKELGQLRNQQVQEVMLEAQECGLLSA